MDATKAIDIAPRIPPSYIVNFFIYMNDIVVNSDPRSSSRTKSLAISYNGYYE